MFDSPRLLVVLLIIAAILLSLSFRSIRLMMANHEQTVFRESSGVVIAHLGSSLDTWMALGYSGRDFIVLNDGIGAPAHLQYAEETLTRHQPVTGAGFIPRILSSARDAYEQEMTAVHGSSYRIFELDSSQYPVTAELRDEYFPIVGVVGPGFDLGSIPAMARMIDSARTSDVAFATSLVPEFSDQTDLLIAYPVFRASDGLLTLTPAADGLAGFSFLNLDVNMVLRDAIRASGESVELSVSAAHHGATTHIGLPTDTPSKLRHLATLKVLDGSWSIEARPSDAWEKAFPVWLSPVVGATLGVILLSLIAATTATLGNRRLALRQAEEMERLSDAKSQFLATVSHELKTPLTSINAFSDILGRNKGRNLTERQTQKLAAISRNGRHLTSSLTIYLMFRD